MKIVMKTVIVTDILLWLCYLDQFIVSTMFKSIIYSPFTTPYAIISNKWKTFLEKLFRDDFSFC